MVYKARIKFDNREWLVIDNIEYEGKKYYYIVEDVSEELEKIENLEDYKGNITIEFIYKLDDENYANVTDQELISKLLAVVGQRAILNPDDLI